MSSSTARSPSKAPRPKSSTTTSLCGSFTSGCDAHSERGGENNDEIAQNDDRAAEPVRRVGAWRIDRRTGGSRRADQDRLWHGVDRRSCRQRQGGAAGDENLGGRNQRRGRAPGPAG